MKLLKQAQTLFSFDKPITLENMRKLDQLCDQAKGEEAERLGDLWEAAITSADEQTIIKAHQEGLI